MADEIFMNGVLLNFKAIFDFSGDYVKKIFTINLSLIIFLLRVELTFESFKIESISVLTFNLLRQKVHR